MKKVILFNLFGLALMVLLTFVLNDCEAAATSAIFKQTDNWLVRAYVDVTNVKLEVRDVDNNLINPSSLSTGLNPETLANDAVNDEVSMAYDNVNNKIYIFYKNSTGLRLITKQLTPAGPFISVNPTSLSFGNVNVGSYSDNFVTVSNTGTALLTLGNIFISGADFSRYGGSCDNNKTLNAGDSCTIGVRFAPSSAGAKNGTLSIPSSHTNKTVTLSGTGVAFEYVDLTGSIDSGWKSLSNGVPFNLSITVANNGTANAGPFVVKGWFSSSTTPGTGQLLFTWNINSLAAGSTISNSFNTSFSNFRIHEMYYIVVHIDANNAIVETNKTNNILTRDVFVPR